MVSDRLERAYVPDTVPETDLQYFEKGGHGARMGWGDNPALLIIDMTKEFTSSDYSLGRSDVGSDAVEANARLLRAGRDNDVPIFYTKVNADHANVYPSTNEAKKAGDPYDPETGNEIHPEIEPQDTDIVIKKHRASAFFDTHLNNMLREFDIDTLVVTGMTTSGCVRATVVDASSSNFHVIIPEECVADRSQYSHEASLFDMDMKYADVTPLNDVVEKLQQ